MVNVKTYAMKDIQPIPDNEYLIGVHSNGNWIHSEPIMKDAPNVLNLKFEDVEKTGLKAIQWYNNTQKIIYATACSNSQAEQIVRFIRKIPEGATLHVYCAKGKSRSVAVANYVRKYYNNETVDDSGHNKHVYNLLERYHNV
ncbi:MAG: hypothetical protein VW551_00440 [Euryarchaeota archaeon]|jgi:predicted protein tyrosine phosphatase